MVSTTVRVKPSVKQTLRTLAHERNETMQAVLEEAVECLRRQYFLEQANAAFAAQKHDAEDWADELTERADWDATLGDGLQGDEA